MVRITSLLTNTEKEFIGSGCIDRKKRWRLFHDLDERLDLLVEALKFIERYRGKDHPLGDWLVKKNLNILSRFRALSIVSAQLDDVKFKKMYRERIMETTKNGRKLYWVDKEGNAGFMKWARIDSIFDSTSLVKGIKGGKTREVLIKAWNEGGIIPLMECKAMPIAEIKAGLDGNREPATRLVKCAGCGRIDRMKQLEDKLVWCWWCEMIMTLD